MGPISFGARSPACDFARTPRCLRAGNIALRGSTGVFAWATAPPNTAAKTTKIVLMRCRSPSGPMKRSACRKFAHRLAHISNRNAGRFDTALSGPRGRNH
jgi:hypothetical protein